MVQVHKLSAFIGLILYVVFEQEEFCSLVEV